jgi:hypothetical protein
MKLLIKICALGLAAASAVLAASEINIDSGASITVTGSAEICAEAITVDAGGSFTSDSPDNACVTPTGSGDVSLPVTLASFTGKASKTGVLLEWETSAEIENTVL